MNHFLRIVLLVALAGCGGATAPETRGTASAGSESTTASPQPFLWEVRSGVHVSYLFGTMHAGAELDNALPERHRASLDSARSVVLEANVADVDQQTTVNASLLPPNRTLDTILPSDVYQGLSTRLAATLPEAALRRMRPWVVSALIAVTSIQQARPEASTTPIDALIGERARERGASIVYLESVADQLGFINEVPEPYFVDELTAFVRTPEVSNQQTSSLVDAYSRGDEAAITTLLFDEESTSSHPEAYEILFYRRNRAWLAQLEPQLRDGGVFVAVGLGHLVGERGLVAGLAARGFVVARLR